MELVVGEKKRENIGQKNRIGIIDSVELVGKKAEGWISKRVF